MITMLAADSSFDTVTLRRLRPMAAASRWPCPGPPRPNHPSGHNISDSPDVGGDNIRPGDLIMLSKGAASALVQVSTVVGQTINFAAERFAAPEPDLDGDRQCRRSAEQRAGGHLHPFGDRASSRPMATRIRMISYYLDVTTDRGGRG